MVKINRWVTLAAGCVIQASSGLNYAFSIITPAIKQQFHFTDMEVSAIAGAISVGGYAAIMSGLAYDAMSWRHNLGPRLVIWVGCVLMVVGYGGMWAQAVGLLAPSLTRMLICGAIAGNAGTWWDTSVLVTNVRNFSDDRGSVLGILKSFLGMSTSIYASVYWAMFAVADPVPAPAPPGHGPRARAAGGFLVGQQGGASAHWAVDVERITRRVLAAHSAAEAVAAGGAESAAQARTPSGGCVGHEAGGWGAVAAAAAHAGRLLRMALGSGEGAVLSAANMAGALSFLGLLATVPAALNLLGSLFINLVPHDYHDPVEGWHHAREELTASEERQQLLPGSAGPPPHPHPHPHPPLHLRHGGSWPAGQTLLLSKAARFTGLYFLVALLAVIQAGSTLAGKGQPAGSDIEKLHAALLLVLLALVLLVPISAGPLARPSLRRKRQQDQQDAPPPPPMEVRKPHVSHPPSAGPSPPRTHAANAANAAFGSKAPSGQRGESTDLEAHQPLLVGHAGAAPPHAPGGSEGSQPHAHPQPGNSGPAWVGSEQGGSAGEEEDANETPPVQNLTPGQALRQSTFWALLFIFLAGSASGLTLLNNLSPLVISLGGHAGGQVAFVSLFSVANASGRLLFGHLSEYAMHKSGLARPLFVLIASVLTSLSTLAMAAGAPLHWLYLVSLLCGLGFGGHWSAIPAVASDLYGLACFGSLYSVLQLAPAVGAIGFASYLAGENLAREAEAAGTGGDCLGLRCFAPTWQALLALDVAALCACLWLLRSTAQAYRRFRPAGKP